MNFKHQIKRALSPLFGPYFKGRGHILMLHRIVPESDHPRVHNTVNEISPKQLSDLIEFYQSHKVDIISITDVPDYLKSGSGYFVVFTFDDGYKDNLTEALPVFESHEVPFTVYITTGFPDNNISIWWYLLEKVLLSNEGIQFNWANQKHQFKCATPQQKEDVFNIIRRIIIDTPFHQQQEQLKTAFSQHTDDPYAITAELAMNWDEIKELAQSPWVTIGAHTVHHPALNQLNATENVEECLGSKERLEAKLNHPVEHFSYPFGSANEVGEREFIIIKEMGFRTATTTRWGSIYRAHLRHLQKLPRIPVKPDISVQFLEEVIKGRENFIRGSKKRVVTI
ncbi:MAG: polysaccharide deacetylase family protein [Cyclobacteriaceae bacterium]|nr:polysaccharide deacetylase family protein [Cyclobacteriaceae bacterium]